MKNLNEMVLIKQNVKLAVDQYQKAYKKTPKGILKLANEILLSDDIKTIKTLAPRFFGNITKSLNAKKRNEI